MSRTLGLTGALIAATALVSGCVDQTNGPAQPTRQYGPPTTGSYAAAGSMPQAGQIAQPAGQASQQQRLGLVGSVGDPPGQLPQQPSQPQQPQPQQPSQPQQPQPQQAAPGLPFAFPFPLPGQPQQNQGTGGAATPLDPNVAGAVAAIPLMAYSQQQAPGMAREGNTVAAQFSESQTLETPVQLQQGKCYTVLAVGVGIQVVNITLVATTPVPGMSPVLAQDTGGGSSAALGGGGSCYRWPLPIPVSAKYVIKATKGSGVAAGQMYSK